MNYTNDIFFQDDYKRRESLPPPPKPSVSWDTYINSSPGDWPNLGRPLKLKSAAKGFKATLAMVSKETAQLHVATCSVICLY